METQKPLTPEQRGEMREVVGVFKDLDNMQSAIDELLTDGFDQSMISVLAPQAVVREALGDQSLSAEKLGENPQAPHGAYIDPEARNEAKASLIGALFYIGAISGAGMALAAGGTLGAAIAAALALGGGGGLIGATLAQLLGSAEATWVKAQMAHGGMLLWARAWDAAKEHDALEIMRRNGGQDVHTHPGAAPA